MPSLSPARRRRVLPGFGHRPQDHPDANAVLQEHWADAERARLRAAWWAARRVVRLPVRTPPGTDPYLDDAFRQYSLTTCLAAAGLGSLATSDLASLVFGLLGGWAAVTWTFAHYGVVIVLLQAMKQPVPWTFGPRIRSAWATPSPVTPPGAGAPRST